MEGSVFHFLHRYEIIQPFWAEWNRSDNTDLYIFHHVTLLNSNVEAEIISCFCFYPNRTTLFWSNSGILHLKLVWTLQVHENAYRSDFHHCFSLSSNSSGNLYFYLVKVCLLTKYELHSCPFPCLSDLNLCHTLVTWILELKGW